MMVGETGGRSSQSVEKVSGGRAYYGGTRRHIAASIRTIRDLQLSGSTFFQEIVQQMLF